MATATNKGVRNTIERVKRAWLEMDEAQRLLFEIRTGVPAGRPQERATVNQLEELYTLESSR